MIREVFLDANQYSLNISSFYSLWVNIICKETQLLAKVNMQLLHTKTIPL
jgi:hypothetical protein